MVLHAASTRYKYRQINRWIEKGSYAGTQEGREAGIVASHLLEGEGQR